MSAIVLKHRDGLLKASDGLERAEEDAKNPLFGQGIRIDRRSEQIVWTRFAIERYRAVISPSTRKQYKKYHPLLWRELRDAWREFRSQIKKWQFGGMPYDGSQAMHSMLAFQVKCRTLASAND